MLLLSGASAVALAADSPLVGKWEAIARSHGGLGSTLELHADGTLATSLGAMVDAKYRVEGGYLITSYTDESTGKTQESKLAIRFETDMLVEKAVNNPAASEIRMKRERAGKPGDAPIVGTWSYPAAHGTARTTFTADGREIFRYPIRTSSGTWSAAGTLLTFGYEGRPPQTANYTLENGVLSVDSKAGTPVKYRRAPDSAPAR